MNIFYDEHVVTEMNSMLAYLKYPTIDCCII